jgi:hypothetical protein
MSGPDGEYEELTRSLVAALGQRMGVLTTRLERNVVMPGRATNNQIDVLW